MNRSFLIAGFGGQGLLFAGKFLVTKGMQEGHEVSWLPSYGPEMRGGTANCSVIISDNEVGSPIVENPDVLMVMNLPSLDKYEDAVVSGGSIFVDSSLVDRKVRRNDVNVYYVPATQIASQNGNPALANMVLVGKILQALGEYDENGVEKALGSVVSMKRPELLGANRRALQLGRDYN